MTGLGHNYLQQLDELDTIRLLFTASSSVFDPLVIGLDLCCWSIWVFGWSGWITFLPAGSS